MFFAIWPMIPNMVWTGCDFLPGCDRETSYMSGINFLGISVDTNLFDIHPEKPVGFIVLGISFFSMGFLVFFRIKKW